MDALVAQMIDFVGEMPPGWQSKWHEILLASNSVPVKSMSVSLESMVRGPRKGDPDGSIQNLLYQDCE